MFERRPLFIWHIFLQVSSAPAKRDIIREQLDCVYVLKHQVNVKNAISKEQEFCRIYEQPFLVVI